MNRYPWKGYSNLLKERILKPRNLGSFPNNRGAMQEMRVLNHEGESFGNRLLLSVIVDETDGIIADAKFQAFGASSLIGAADSACEVLLRKSYEQARRLSSDLIDRKLRDFPDAPAFPPTASSALNLVLTVIEEIGDQCTDIPLLNPDIAPPVPNSLLPEGEGDPNWQLLSEGEKLDRIKQVINADIQPYIELDAGGIEVLSFKDQREVIIAYQGACTSCPSATGATLNAIQQILRSKLHPSLEVKPDLSLLNFS